jgi:hypothetical protein
MLLPPHLFGPGHGGATFTGGTAFFFLFQLGVTGGERGLLLPGFNRPTRHVVVLVAIGSTEALDGAETRFVLLLGEEDLQFGTDRAILRLLRFGFTDGCSALELFLRGVRLATGADLYVREKGEVKGRVGVCVWGGGRRGGSSRRDRRGSRRRFVPEEVLGPRICAIYWFPQSTGRFLHFRPPWVAARPYWPV